MFMSLDMHIQYSNRLQAAQLGFDSWQGQEISLFHSTV